MAFVVLPIVLLLVFLVAGIIWFTPELRANFFMWRGNVRTARRIYENLLEQNPEKVHLYKRLGMIYYLENRRDRRALRVFEIILKLRIPFQWRDEIRHLVAKHYVTEGRKDAEAIRLIEKVVEKEMNRLRLFA